MLAVCKEGERGEVVLLSGCVFSPLRLIPYRRGREWARSSGECTTEWVGGVAMNSKRKRSSYRKDRKADDNYECNSNALHVQVKLFVRYTIDMAEGVHHSQATAQPPRRFACSSLRSNRSRCC